MRRRRRQEEVEVRNGGGGGGRKNGEACGRKEGERTEDEKEVYRKIYEEGNVRSAQIKVRVKQKVCVKQTRGGWQEWVYPNVFLGLNYRLQKWWMKHP